MTKTGYTHVLIPKNLHSVLRENAKAQETSIWRYIEALIPSKLRQAERRTLNPTAVGSNPSQPV
ncbi:MAG: hypothetical protein WA130_11765 [Candidatus Methanoperedens sp.]